VNSLNKLRVSPIKVRLGLFIFFSCLFMAQSMGVLPIYGGTASWDITSGFNFRPSNSYGLIRFNTATQATDWAFSGEFVSFTSVSVGGGLLYSSLGYSCSSNADMNITTLGVGSMEYIVTAVAGQVSTTKVQFPVKATIQSVTNSDSFSYDDVTNVVTVTKTHGGSETLTINFIKGGSGLDDFDTVRSTWMYMFLLFALITGLGTANQVMRGEVQITGYMGVIVLAVITAMFMILLSITEGVWP